MRHSRRVARPRAAREGNQAGYTATVYPASLSAHYRVTANSAFWLRPLRAPPL
jgi:hypothetical protein